NNTTKTFPVTVEDKDLVPTYAGITISDIEVKPSPKWLQNRLKAIGLNPKNNIIDITNYVLHDLGQPLHAFDLDKLEGGIVVKTLAKDTSFTTLDGVERKLSAEDLMICDQKKPLCIAGVFGGLESGVNDETTSVFIESAYFDPISIRKTAKRHGLNTDASFRYERGIDPEITEFALKYAASMIVDIAGGFVSSEIETVAQEQEPEINFMLNYEFVWRTIGQKISIDDLIKILNALEIRINQATESGMVIEIPKYRVDVTRPADVIEEILRVYGYNKIETPDTLHTNLPKYSPISKHNTAELMSKQLVSQGFNEMINNSITSPSYADLSESISKIAPVNILNPLGKEISQLRTSLLPSALEVIAFNLKRQSKRLKFFELGKVYQEKNDGYKESKFISLVFTGAVYEENWNVQNQPGNFFFFKGVLNQLIQKKTAQEWIESPTEEDVYTEGLNYKINNKTLLNFGYVKDDILKKFDIDQTVLYAELDIEFLFDLTLRNKLKFKEIPKFPVSRRDFALLLNEEVAFNEIKSLALKTEKNILKEIKLFDVYIGKNLPE
ncbi:MAG: phenylalanine--tRNA ligase subunit beta, partial [Flavobacteriales bacterium]